MDELRWSERFTADEVAAYRVATLWGDESLADFVDRTADARPDAPVHHGWVPPAHVGRRAEPGMATGWGTGAARHHGR
jgi:hypothetical protein